MRVLIDYWEDEEWENKWVISLNNIYPLKKWVF